MQQDTYHFPKKTVRDVPIHDKRVLVRVDFNVPLNEAGEITSDFRIQSFLPTLTYLLQRNCEVILLSHLGRPDGRKNAAFSLRPTAARLAELSGTTVNFVADCVGDSVRQSLKRVQLGKVTLLENLRFHTGEEANDPEFAKQLIAACKPSYVVQDGFGVVHRAHASTEGISHLAPAVAGLLLESEVTTLSAAIQSPERPLVAVLGGAKIADKLPLVHKFLETADTVLVGGAMANNFFKAQGSEVGESLLDEEGIALVGDIIDQAKPGQLQLPTDVAVAKPANDSRVEVQLSQVSTQDRILDIGNDTMRRYSNYIKTAGTVIWNGTLGYAEKPEFAAASAQVARAMADKHGESTTIIGGGDTADFVLDWKEHNEGDFTHISTGGGASLELMSGEKLPGVEALLDN